MIFKSRSCFSGVFGYPGLAVVGELGSDGAMLPWFLLVMFLCLPFARCLSLVVSGLAVSLWLDCPTSFCICTPGRLVLSGKNLVMESCDTGSA